MGLYRVEYAWHLSCDRKGDRRPSASGYLALVVQPFVGGCATRVTKSACGEILHHARWI